MAQADTEILTQGFYRWWYQYETIKEILEEDGKVDTNIILGDWNSIVRDESYQNIVGSHGVGTQNHRGQMLIDFCERNGLIVTNTWFKKP